MWTDKEKAQVKAWWHKGATASEISTRLRGKSRSAVQALLCRLGLKRSRALPPDERLQRRRERNRRAQRSYEQRHKAKIRVKRQQKRRIYGLERPPPRTIALPDAPAALSILEVRASQCRFMPGTGYLCCGLPAEPNSSWCEKHQEIVFE